MKKSKFRETIKRIVAVIFSLSLLSMNSLFVLAQDKIDNNVLIEYQDKLKSGLEVYEIIDNNGSFIGYFEEGTEAMPKYGSSINWTVGSKQFTYGDNRYTLGNGNKITVNISQSTSGESYIVLVQPDSKVVTRLTSSMTTNGWKSIVITLGGISTDVYAFGIANYSSKSITYSGTYSL